MINYKKQQRLDTEEKWPKVSSVFIQGIPNETNIDAKFPVEEKEERSQSWKNGAVFKVTAPEATIFYIGFANMGTIEYLEHEFKTDLEFGMRIGGGDVRIFVLPKDLSKGVNLELVETVNEDNPKYQNLMLI